jgi:hypothetical protein
MYVDNRTTGDLGDVSGIFSKIKKAKKKLLKKVKRVAKPLAHVAAAYFTGGASLAISAQMLARKKQQKAMQQQEQQQAQAAAQGYEGYGPPEAMARSTGSAMMPRFAPQTDLEEGSMAPGGMFADDDGGSKKKMLLVLGGIGLAAALAVAMKGKR